MNATQTTNRPHFVGTCECNFLAVLQMFRRPVQSERQTAALLTTGVALWFLSDIYYRFQPAKGVRPALLASKCTSRLRSSSRSLCTGFLWSLWRCASAMCRQVTQHALPGYTIAHMHASMCACTRARTHSLWSEKYNLDRRFRINAFGDCIHFFRPFIWERHRSHLADDRPIFFFKNRELQRVRQNAKNVLPDGIRLCQRRPISAAGTRHTAQVLLHVPAVSVDLPLRCC